MDAPARHPVASLCQSCEDLDTCPGRSIPHPYLGCPGFWDARVASRFCLQVSFPPPFTFRCHALTLGFDGLVPAGMKYATYRSAITLSGISLILVPLAATASKSSACSLDGVIPARH